MKASEYIKLLEKLISENGDLDIYIYNHSGVRMLSRNPEVRNLRILSKREHRGDLWDEWRSNCTIENKGEKVIYI